MSNFAFRITIEELRHEFKFIDECQKVIIYKHEADASVSRTHYHGLIINYPKKEQTLRNCFVKKYEYTLKCTGITPNFITYMSKGKLEPHYKRWKSEEEASGSWGKG